MVNLFSCDFMSQKILIVEDDPKIASFLANGFGETGFVVDSAQDGMRGLELALAQRDDLSAQSFAGVLALDRKIGGQFFIFGIGPELGRGDAGEASWSPSRAAIGSNL